jgi:hypothetical protein
MGGSKAYEFLAFNIKLPFKLTGKVFKVKNFIWRDAFDFPITRPTELGPHLIEFGSATREVSSRCQR